MCGFVCKGRGWSKGMKWFIITIPDTEQERYLSYILNWCKEACVVLLCMQGQIEEQSQSGVRSEGSETS